MKAMLSKAFVAGSFAESHRRRALTSQYQPSLPQALRAGGEPLVSFVAHSSSGQVFSFLGAI